MSLFFESNQTTSQDSVSFDRLIKSATEHRSLGVLPTYEFEGAVEEIIEDTNEEGNVIMDEGNSSDCEVIEADDIILEESNIPDDDESDTAKCSTVGSIVGEVDAPSVESDVNVPFVVLAPKPGNLSEDLIEDVAIESCFTLSGWDWKFCKDFNGVDFTTVDHGIFQGLGLEIDVEDAAEVVLYGFDQKMANCGRFRNRRRCHNWYGSCAQAGGNCPTQRHRDLYRDFIFTRTAVELALKQHDLAGK